jgi:hypothetical protein
MRVYYKAHYFFNLRLSPPLEGLGEAFTPT